jgi:hypothetical protein
MMIQPVSNQSTQLQPALGPLTEEEESRSNLHDATQPSQQQVSSALAPPPIVNRYALALAQHGPNAKLATSASVSPSTSSTAHAAACMPSASAPASSAQAPSRSGDSSVWGWVEHTAGAVTSTVSGAVKSGINRVVDGQRATDKLVTQAGGAIDSAVNSATRGIDHARTDCQDPRAPGRYADKIDNSLRLNSTRPGRHNGGFKYAGAQQPMT